MLLIGIHHTKECLDKIFDTEFSLVLQILTFNDKDGNYDLKNQQRQKYDTKEVNKIKTMRKHRIGYIKLSRNHQFTSKEQHLISIVIEKCIVFELSMVFNCNAFILFIYYQKI